MHPYRAARPSSMPHWRSARQASDYHPSFGAPLSRRARICSPKSQSSSIRPQRSRLSGPGRAGDEFDPMANVLYTGGGIPGPAPTSEAQFVVWCKSIGCQAISRFPGEIDDPTMAAEVVLYTEVNLSFHPAYWEIGNEPNLWHRWGTPWSQWGYRVHLPSYADWVRGGGRQLHPGHAGSERTNSVCLRALGNGTPAAAAPCRTHVDDWINETVAINGPNIAAVAFHEYPASSSRINPCSPINVSLGVLQLARVLERPTRTDRVHRTRGRLLDSPNVPDDRATQSRFS